MILFSADNFLDVNAQNFENVVLQIFRFQAQNTPIYKAYLAGIGVNPTQIKRIEDIPFLPINFFRTHKVIAEEKTAELIFESSGTTSTQNSKHFVAKTLIYEKSFLKAFELAYGSPRDFVILALLPSYLERGNSSLVYMANKLIQESKKNESGFYLHNYQALANTLQQLEKQKQKTVLIGVTYALLDLAEQYPMQLKNTILLETGGMKGRRKEMVKEELHAILKTAFACNKIHSEYGMTELLSQAYSHGDNVFFCPPWMKILIRDPSDPFALLPNGRIGGINIIDLANVYSCSFIATQDLGKLNTNGTFEVLGRFDDADLRGCNLMMA